MTRLSYLRRRSVRLGTAALLAVLVTAAVATPAAGVGPTEAPTQAPTEDAQVIGATGDLDQARLRADELSRSLDETAAGYEQANAHKIRVEDELADADDVVANANAAVAAAEQTLSERVAAVYKHPGEDLAMADALLLAPDAASALHRAALYRRIAQRSADEVEDVRLASTLTTTDVAQEQVIAAGAAASAADWRRHARALSTQLTAAQDEVARAEDVLATAKVEAQRRADAAEAARVAAAAAPISVNGAVPVAPLPAVDGKVCPVGQPNGFIDSWGFPRSGGRTHEGVDIFAAYDTPLFAVADGHIYRVYNNPLGGLSINLIDNDGNMYYYTHMSRAAAVTGQIVRAGEVIGFVGTSGNAAGTPPHLHWQYHPGNGEPVNPYPLAYALCRQ